MSKNMAILTKAISANSMHKGLKTCNNLMWLEELPIIWCGWISYKGTAGSKAGEVCRRMKEWHVSHSRMWTLGWEVKTFGFWKDFSDHSEKNELARTED